MNKRSPLKEPPLRLPGQSADEAIHTIYYEELMPAVTVVLAVALMAFYEWLAWAFDIQRHPWLLTLAVVIVFGMSYRKMGRAVRGARQMRLGREGEKAVGQALEGLREKGYRVLHDIVIPGKFNIDHMLIGPGGIFVIETKTRSKPLKGDARVDYDGKRVTVNGWVPDRNPVEQVQACRDWVRDQLKSEATRDFPLRGVVLFPGWFVNDQPKGCEVWVMNEKSLAKFLEHEREKMTADDIQCATAILTRYVRATKAEP